MSRPTATLSLEYVGLPGVPYRVPAAVSLRRLLKSMLRGYGWKLVRVTTTGLEDDTAPADKVNSANRDTLQSAPGARP